MRTVRIALILVVGSISAHAQSTRDSAGIQITANAKPAWAPGRGWRLAEKPILVLGGGSDERERIGRITGVTRLSDGRVVVADQSTLQLKFYDASGKFLTAAGGKGEGPGEFRSFHSFARLAGDTIVVDAPEKSVIFAPNGSFVRAVAFGPFPPGSLQTPYAGALGRFDNGRAVAADFPQGRQGPAGARQWVDSASLFLLDRSGAVVRPLGKAAVVVFAAGKTHAAPMDFGPQAVYASSGRTFYLGFSNEYSIRAYDSDWKLERIIRRAWTPRRLTASEIDAYVDGWMQMWSKKTGAERDAERKEMREQPYPESLTAYSAIIATRGGELWVREPDLTGAPGCWCLSGIPTVPSTWSVFDARGRWLGDVSMPPRFVPLEIGDDYVLGRSRDEGSVSRVVMYRLEKRS
jgi:hypothetical protein